MRGVKPTGLCVTRMTPSLHISARVSIPFERSETPNASFFRTLSVDLSETVFDSKIGPAKTFLEVPGGIRKQLIVRSAVRPLEAIERICIMFLPRMELGLKSLKLESMSC